MSNNKPMLFYSKKCVNCQKLWALLSQQGKLNDYLKICVEENPTRIPPMIKEVPSILISKDRPIISGAAIPMFLKSVPSQASVQSSSVPNFSEKPNLEWAEDILEIYYYFCCPMNLNQSSVAFSIEFLSQSGAFFQYSIFARIFETPASKDTFGDQPNSDTIFLLLAHVMSGSPGRFGRKTFSPPSKFASVLTLIGLFEPKFQIWF